MLRVLREIRDSGLVVSSSRICDVQKDIFSWVAASFSGFMAEKRARRLSSSVEFIFVQRARRKTKYEISFGDNWKSHFLRLIFVWS